MEFSAKTVADMLGRDASWVMEQCDELVRKQFWLCHGGIAESARGAFDVHYAFLHALYQHVFYSYLSPAQRVTLHRRAAQSMENARAEGMTIPAAQLASHYERGHQIVPALRYYTEAARHAVAHFAPNDAIRLTETAVALLERVPDTHERSELALALVHQRGIASAQLFGIGSDQAVASFEQAQRFCDLLPESSMHALLLNGMALTRYVQGDYAQACAIADRVSITGERNGDRILQMVSNMLRGIIHGVQAEHQLATKKLELARLACAAVSDRLPYTAFVVDPISSIHANFALPLVHLGLIDQAREHIRLASQRAQSIGQPTAQMFVLWMAGMLEVRCDAPEKVSAIAALLNDFVEKNMIAHGYGPAHWLRGWAQARLGSPQEGYRLIREGYESHARLGMFTGNTETLVLAAEALILAGDDAAAERELDEATQLATRIDERMANCSLLLLRARIAGRRKQADAEHEFMRRALVQARSEASPYHELKSLVALCSSSFATREDLGALRQLSLAWQEGRDLPLLARAAELLH